MPRLPDCRIVGSELIFSYTSHGDALVGYRMIRDAVEAAEKVAKHAPAPKPMNIRVGGKYRDGTGTDWVIEEIDLSMRYPVIARRDGGTWLRTFTLLGHFAGDEESVLDLVEEVAPPCPTIHDCRAGQTERCTCCDREG